MRIWEPVEISVNRVDVEDVITTSFGAADTPFVGGGSDTEDIMGGIRDN